MTGDYLWDRGGWPDPEIQRLERLLGRFAYDPASAPRLRVVSTPPRAFAAALLAIAASVVALVSLTWSFRPAASGLEVRSLAGTPTMASRPLTDPRRMLVGSWLVTDNAARASIDVAGVGRVEVEPETRIGLLSTRPGDYRLHLSRGTMQAVIWAPAGQVSVKTPSSTAVDLGCVYTMTVDDDGVGLVRVTVGWVGFEWQGRESFIPAGAVCITRPGLGPGTPHYDDTSAAFRDALQTIDLGLGSPAMRSAAVDRVMAESRPRDTVTLWHLLSRVDPIDRDRVFARLAELAPPPSTVTMDGVRAGRREMLDAWWDTLNLGATTWWRMWKQQWREK